MTRDEVSKLTSWELRVVLLVKYFHTQDVLRRVHDEHQRYSQLCQQLDETNNNYSILKKELDDLKYEFLRMKYDLKPLGP